MHDNMNSDIGSNPLRPLGILPSLMYAASRISCLNPWSINTRDDDMKPEEVLGIDRKIIVFRQHRKSGKDASIADFIEKTKTECLVVFPEEAMAKRWGERFPNMPCVICSIDDIGMYSVMDFDYVILNEPDLYECDYHLETWNKILRIAKDAAVIAIGTPIPGNHLMRFIENLQESIIYNMSRTPTPNEQATYSEIRLRTEILAEYVDLPDERSDDEVYCDKKVKVARGILETIHDIDDMIKIRPSRELSIVKRSLEDAKLWFREDSGPAWKAEE